MKLEFQSAEYFPEVQRYLINVNAQFRTYSLDENKPLKAVFRGLPFKTSTEDIKLALTCEGYYNIDVTEMYRGP